MQETKKVKEKPVQATEYIITAVYSGKKDLKDIWVDLLYSAYRRQQASNFKA